MTSKDKDKIESGLKTLADTIVTLFISAGLFVLTWNHIAPKFFYWLPSVYWEVSYWEAFCFLFAVRTLARGLLLKIGEK